MIPILRTIAAILAAVAATAPAAQPERASPRPSPSKVPAGAPPVSPAAPRTGQRPPIAAPTPVALSDAPYRFETAGLTMFLPEIATANLTTIGAKAALEVLPPDASWVIKVQAPRTSNPDTTAAEVVDEVTLQHLKEAGEIYEAVPGEKLDPSKLRFVKGRILEPRRTMVIGGLQAERVYFAIPQGLKDPAVVRGYTVFKTGPDRFVTFELVTTEPHFAKARAAYEVSVGSATFTDPTTAVAERAAAVQSGIRVLDALTEGDYKDILAAQPERWERLYKAAPTGADSDATELGYRRILTSIGPRSMLDGGRRSGRGVADRQEGYIVQLEARVLREGLAFDTQSVLFMSPDGAEEAWTTKMAIRKDGQTRTATETGARTGQSMSVQIESTGAPGKIVKPSLQSEGYVSRAEALLLPQLLIRSGVATDYGFYGYQPDAEAVRLRRDTLEQPIETPGLWRLTTKLGEDKPVQVSLYNAQGELIRTEMADGTIWEPTTLDALKRLWQSKGLPLD